jgi:hypothetical protein
LTLNSIISDKIDPTKIILAGFFSKPASMKTSFVLILVFMIRQSASFLATRERTSRVTWPKASCSKAKKIATELLSVATTEFQSPTKAPDIIFKDKVAIVRQIIEKKVHPVPDMVPKNILTRCSALAAERFGEGWDGLEWGLDTKRVSPLT